MLKKKRYILLAIVAVVAFVLVNLPASTASRLRLAISSQFLPFFGLARFSQDVAGSTADLALSKSELIRQNELLRRENEQLKAVALQANQFAQENARLSQQVGWQAKMPWRMKAARVVLRDPANWWSTVQIDVGSQQGIQPNMPVMAIDGLVGRITAVGLTRSQVVLIGDPNCRVAAYVENEARDNGVTGDSSPLERELVELNYLGRNAVIKPGHRVLTSNMGGNYPSGIPVGVIVDARQVDYGLSTEARVKLFAKLGSLEEVWVITQWSR
jgi:rod shape-determining protein MreC